MAGVDDGAGDGDICGAVLTAGEILLAEPERSNLALGFAVVDLEAAVGEAALEAHSLLAEAG